MIRVDAVMQLLLEATPSFGPVWRDLQADHMDAGSNRVRLHYLDAATFAVHLIDLHKEYETAQVQDAFDVIEHMAIDGNSYVQNLATLGYLEPVQCVVLADRALTDDDFVAYLGPISLLAWVELHHRRGTTDPSFA